MRRARSLIQAARAAIFASGVALGLLSDAAAAHDRWADWTPVPAWVKQACCGASDAHHLRPDQVRRISDEYYEVEGYFRPVPARAALPSEDGQYWIFYRNVPAGPICPGPGQACFGWHPAGQTRVFCFFVPMDF